LKKIFELEEMMQGYMPLRVAHILCWQVNSGLCLTHQEIAEMAFTSRESVTRTLKKFRSRGLITFGSGWKARSLQIPDKARLMAEAQEIALHR